MATLFSTKFYSTKKMKFGFNTFMLVAMNIVLKVSGRHLFYFFFNKSLKFCGKKYNVLRKSY